MIQLNLLPDVKLEYLRAQRTRRTAISLSVLVAGIALALLVLLLITDGVQYKHLQDLSKDISKESSQLKNEPQISNILTVQNQLESLTNLHEKKPAVSRLFDYLNEVTPAQVNISSFSADFTQNTMTITGGADSLASVNKYVDTLKFATYNSDNAQNTAAFSNVVLSSFGLSSATSGQNSSPASYTINLSYDPTLFDNTQKVTMNIPNKVTTRSAVEQPTDLFQASNSQSNSGGGQ